MEAPCTHSETIVHIPTEYLRDEEFTRDALLALRAETVRGKHWNASAVGILQHAFLPDTLAGWEEIKHLNGVRVRTGVYEEFQDIVVEVLPFLVRTCTSASNTHDPIVAERVIGAVLASIPDKSSLLRHIRRTPEFILVCDAPLSGIPSYGRRIWCMDTDMLCVALGETPQLYSSIRRGYEREDVLRWGVRHGLDMRTVFQMWTGKISSPEFRTFHRIKHPRMFDEEFGDTLHRTLPFPLHLITRITEFIVYRGSGEDIYLPRNLPVRIHVAGLWMEGKVRKIKHPLYTIKVAPAKVGEKAVFLDVMDYDIRYEDEDLKKFGPVQHAVRVSF